MEPFLIKSMIGGCALALIAGPLGCFILWRRMAFFGDALAHSALLGIGLAIIFSINISASIMVMAIIFAGVINLLHRGKFLSFDASLGIMSHGAFAIAVILLTSKLNSSVDLWSYLFGDILTMTDPDLWFILLIVPVGIVILTTIWRSLIMMVLNEDLAKAEGVKVGWVSFIYMVLVAIVIAIAIRMVGVLLTTSLLLIPAATARILASSPFMMAIMAALIGMLSVVFGLTASLSFNSVSGPTIVLSAFILFLLTQLLVIVFGKKQM